MSAASEGPAASPIDVGDSRGVPIAEVSRVLGIPMPTLRSWELRYAMPTIRHTGGRHRRYLPAEVHALRLMRDEIVRGQPASAAAAAVHQMLGIGGPAGVFIHRMLENSQGSDVAGMWSTLDQAAAALGLAVCVDEVLLPTMRQVGIWWEVGYCDIARERISTEAVRGWLDKRMSFAPAPIRPHPILLACGPNDWHTIGAECLAMLLRYQGWPCRLLGARVPAPRVSAAVRASDAAAVVVVSQLATGRRAAVDSIRAVHQLPLPVFYAGSAFSTERSRRGAPGTYLGISITDACDQVVSALTTAAALPTAG